MTAKERIHVFYMEDEEIILDQISELLELENCRVIKSRDAEEALLRIDKMIEKKERVDVFFLDTIIFPWNPFTEEETLQGFITGLRVADYIIKNYVGINDAYRIIFATAALGVAGKVKDSVIEYIRKHKDRCSILPKPTDFEKMKAFLTIES